jgi:hypothetical protein
MIKSCRKGNKEEKEKIIGSNGPMVWPKAWLTRRGQN